MLPRCSGSNLTVFVQHLRVELLSPVPVILTWELPPPIIDTEHDAASFEPARKAQTIGSQQAMADNRTHQRPRLIVGSGRDESLTHRLG